MRLETIFTTAILALLNPVIHAGEVPDILWRTNAHRFGYDVQSLRFSPDSASVFSGAGEAKHWRVADTVLLRTFTIPNEDIGAIALSPDGTRLVGWGPNRGFRMWRVADGAVLDSSFASGSSLAFSPSGDFIARGTLGGSVILLPVNGESITSGTGYDEMHSGAVNGLAFSPDGSLLLSGGNDSTAKLLRVADGVVVQTFWHSRYVKSVAFSLNGKTIATGVSQGNVRVWSTNGTVLHTLATGEPTVSMDFSPDGKLLVTTSRGLIQFWRVADGAHLVTYDPDPAGEATGVDISPDGKLFAYGTSLGALVLARMPTLVTKAEKRTNQFNFEWQGGSGLYQVQQTTSLTAGVWANLGPPRGATNLAVPMTNPVAFFRVLSLPNP